MPWDVWWGRLQKDRWDRCLFPITPSVTHVLGGEAPGAFNAPARVRASGGGQCPCSRRFLIRSRRLPCSTAVGARALIDSLDATSVFEAAAVDGRAYTWAGHRIEDLVLCTDGIVICVGEGTPC